MCSKQFAKEEKMINKLSTGFTGSATRGSSGFDREVESRLHRLDMFTDEFSPPYSREIFPGADFTKRSAPYEAKHDMETPEADPQFWDKSIRAHSEKHMHAAGDPKEQDKLDWLDEIAHKMEAPIKSPYDQFPGAVDMSDHKEIASFDPHQTDPARLKKMDKNKVDGPDSFNKVVEKRMKKLVEETSRKTKVVNGVTYFWSDYLGKWYARK